MNAANGFINDAYAQAKFVGVVAAAQPLFAAGLTEMVDGFVPLEGPKDAACFVALCRKRRFGAREALVHAV